MSMGQEEHVIDVTSYGQMDNSNFISMSLLNVQSQYRPI
jgi:hypothetical protein